MDPQKHQHEFALIVGRAKRQGLVVHEYPDQQVAVIRVPPAKPPQATDTPPAEAPATQPPAAT